VEARKNSDHFTSSISPGFQLWSNHGCSGA
jgi:hypothetical protein